MQFLTINFISVVVWTLPAIRNRKSDYFYFFLILASIDPICLVTSQILKKDPTILILIFSVLNILFIDKKRIKVRYLLHKILFIIIIFITVYLLKQGFHILIAVFDFVILGIILHIFLEDIFRKQLLNIFKLVILFYYVLVIVNSIFILTDIPTAIHYFYFTLTTMIAIGIFFTIFSDNSKVLIFHLKKK